MTLLRCTVMRIAVARRASTVDKREVQVFGELSKEWVDESGPFKALYSLNKLRVPWILKNMKVPSSTVVDIGCGGGLLSIPLARKGFKVTGVDATPEAVVIARNMADVARKSSTSPLDVTFEHNSVEEFAKVNSGTFDCVIASEILEHVSDLNSFVESCSALAKPGSPLFFTTINRTLLSKVSAIWLAENVLKIVPEGVHDWNKFVSPDELSSLLEKNGCRVRAVNGFTYNPVSNNWSWIPSTAVNYSLIAERV